jgi:hypothetical protein
MKKLIIVVLTAIAFASCRVSAGVGIGDAGTTKKVQRRHRMLHPHCAIQRQLSNY